MTEKAMIPLSVIDALIASLEIGNNYCYECGIDYQDYAREILEDLKKEAISTFVQSPIEQKINARIAFIENQALKTADLFDNMLDARIIDELRKLLE
jgi:hypothetical protein